jgi:hypothetical protein
LQQLERSIERDYRSVVDQKSGRPTETRCACAGRLGFRTNVVSVLRVSICCISRVVWSRVLRNDLRVSICCISRVVVWSRVLLKYSSSFIDLNVQMTKHFQKERDPITFSIVAASLSSNCVFAVEAILSSVGVELEVGERELETGVMSPPLETGAMSSCS